MYFDLRAEESKRSKQTTGRQRRQLRANGLPANRPHCGKIHVSVRRSHQSEHRIQPKRVENLPPLRSNLGQNKLAQCDRKDLTAYFQTTPGWCNWQHTRLWIWLSWFESRPRSQIILPTSSSNSDKRRRQQGHFCAKSTQPCGNDWGVPTGIAGSRGVNNAFSSGC